MMMMTAISRIDRQIIFCVVDFTLFLLQIWQMFAEMNQSLRPLYDGVMDNKKHWQELADDHERKTTGKING